MTERTQEEIVAHIRQVLEEYIDPVVAQHGGEVRFSNYDSGVVMLEMSGACSGCAGSTATLKYGVEAILTQEIPEVVTVEGFDDPFSMVDPFYTDPFMYESWETIDLVDLTDEGSDDSRS